jgi:hypothetical protein
MTASYDHRGRARNETMRVEVAVRLAHREGKPATWRECLVAMSRALDITLGAVPTFQFTMPRAMDPYTNAPGLEAAVDASVRAWPDEVA